MRSAFRLTLLTCCIELGIWVTAGYAEPRQGENAGFSLTRAGKPACTIVVSDKPTPAARLAAMELQFHILTITGADLPVRTDRQEVTGPRILVGESAATREMGLAASDFASQEYLVAFRPDTLVLIGRDWQDSDVSRREFARPMSCGDTLADTRQRIDYWKTVGYPDRSTGEMELPGVYDDQGTCHAAYHFLEQRCQVRWYGPGVAGTVWPERRDLQATGPDIRRSPALKYRDALWSGNWPFMQGQWGPVTRPEVYLYWRRLRLGGERWAANHTFHPRTLQAVLNDPQYQAQGPGRGTQLCYTSPALVAKVAQMARDFFDGKVNAPEGWKAAGDYFAIVPDDNANFCQCDQCRPLLASGKDMGTGQFSSGTVSNYWFSFVNAVAREVGRTHPGRYIATLAYWEYAHVPRGIEIEPNVSVAPCLHTCVWAIHQEMRENDMKFYGEWLQKARAPVFLWNYYHHPMEPAIIQQWKCFPSVMVHESARAARMFARDGIRGVFVCGEPDMLEAYVIAKVWDDPDTDVDALLDEFFRRYFGAAAEPMKRFYLGLERIACDPRNYPPPVYRRNGIDWKNVAWAHLGTEQRMEELGGQIAEAQRSAQTDMEKRRVSLWREALWKWMQEGRAQHLGTAAAQPEN